MKPETKFRTRKVIPFLKTLKNCAYFPIQQLAIVGDADFVMCIKGKFIWLELKSEEGKARRIQEYKLNWVKICGGIGLIASPGNWEEIKKKLSQLDKE